VPVQLHPQEQSPLSLAKSQALKVSYVIQHNLEKMHPHPARGRIRRKKKHETADGFI